MSTQDDILILTGWLEPPPIKQEQPFAYGISYHCYRCDCEGRVPKDTEVICWYCEEGALTEDPRKKK